MIDVAAGDKIPRKGGPGIIKSDLLVINKIDLAPMVGASLEVMDRDAKKNARRAAVRLLQPEDRAGPGHDRHVHRNRGNAMRSAAAGLIALCRESHAHPGHGAADGHFHGWGPEHALLLVVVLAVLAFAARK